GRVTIRFGPKGRLNQPRPKAWGLERKRARRPEGPVHSDDGNVNGPFRAETNVAIRYPRLRLGLYERPLWGQRIAGWRFANRMAFRPNLLREALERSAVERLGPRSSRKARKTAIATGRQEVQDAGLSS